MYSQEALPLSSQAAVRCAKEPSAILGNSYNPAVPPCRFVRQGRPELGLPLFQAECLKWPGFVEFDDVNCKILTYSAVNRCAAADDSGSAIDT